MDDYEFYCEKCFNEDRKEDPDLAKMVVPVQNTPLTGICGDVDLADE